LISHHHYLRGSRLEAVRLGPDGRLYQVEAAFRAVESCQQLCGNSIQPGCSSGNLLYRIHVCAGCCDECYRREHLVFSLGTIAQRKSSLYPTSSPCLGNFCGSLGRWTGNLESGDANGQFWKCRANRTCWSAWIGGPTSITSSLELRLTNLTRDEAQAIVTRTIRDTFRARRSAERATSDVADDEDHESGVQLQGMVFDNAVGHAQVFSHSNLTSLCRPPNATTA
jgi:hypothetical protein